MTESVMAIIEGDWSLSMGFLLCSNFPINTCIHLVKIKPFPYEVSANVTLHSFDEVGAAFALRAGKVGWPRYFRPHFSDWAESVIYVRSCQGETFIRFSDQLYNICNVFLKWQLYLKLIFFLGRLNQTVWFSLMSFSIISLWDFVQGDHKSLSNSEKKLGLKN